MKLKLVENQNSALLLILPGWGFAPEVFQTYPLAFSLLFPDIPCLTQGELEELCSSILAFRDRELFVLGWSLGCITGTKLIARLHAKTQIKGLILVAPFIRFSKAMVDKKLRELKEDETKALQSFFYACFNGQRHALKLFTKLYKRPSIEFWKGRLAHGLRYLKNETLNDSVLNCTSTLIVTCKNDQIVAKENALSPPSLSTVTAKTITSGHAPFFSKEFYEVLSSIKKRS